MEDKLYICIYLDQIRGVFTEEFLDNCNLCYVELPKEIVFDFFKEECMAAFKSDHDEGISEYGLFEEWLDEYIADDTDGLYDYATVRGVIPLIDSFL